MFVDLKGSAKSLRNNVYFLLENQKNNKNFKIDFSCLFSNNQNFSYCDDNLPEMKWELSLLQILIMPEPLGQWSASKFGIRLCSRLKQTLPCLLDLIGIFGTFSGYKINNNKSGVMKGNPPPSLFSISCVKTGIYLFRYQNYPYYWWNYCQL